jgi:hypothetical protein
MPFVRAVAFLVLPIVFAATPAAAQEIISEKALSLDLAHAIAQGLSKNAGQTATTSA